MAMTISNLLSVFKSSVNIPVNDWTLGVDVSHWQGTTNWAKMYSKGVRFGIYKATDFTTKTKVGFRDSQAFINYENTRANNIINGGYHWLQPKVDPYVQADYYLNEYWNGHETDMAPVVDFEDANVNTWNDYLWRLQVYLDEIEKATGRLAIVYTAPGFMASFDKTKLGFLSKHPLWLAHYIQRAYPTVPYPWDKYFMWQYSYKADYPYYIHGSVVANGKDYGVQSSYLDMNWYPGTLEQLRKEIGMDVSIPQPPIDPEPVDPTEPIDDCKKIKFEVLTDSLNIRSEPKVSSSTFTGKKLFKGDIVEFDQSFAPNENWIYDKKVGWIAEKHGGIQYLKRVE